MARRSMKWVTVVCTSPDDKLELDWVNEISDDATEPEDSEDGLGPHMSVDEQRKCEE